MPASYHSAAEALSVSPSLPTSPSPDVVPWSRRDASPSRRGRISEPALRVGGGPQPFLARIWTSAKLLNEQVIRAFLRLTPAWRAAAVLAIVAAWAVLVLVAMYSHAFFEWLAPVSKSWREMRAGWLIIFVIVVLMSFPPMIGYTTASTVSGFVYGFPLGWPVVAAATVVGSLGAFVASRTVLSRYVDRMVGKDPRFVALGQVLRREGLLYLTAIRFCPLPYSLSNGFLATIPSIAPLPFALATGLASPKLLVPVFIGSRLAILAEKGDTMTLGDKLVNYFSMFVGGSVGIVVGLVIYRRTMARAAELARDDGHGAEDGAAGDFDFEDGQETMMDPEDAAALMSDDDVSLWETQVADYQDEEWPDEEDAKKTGKVYRDEEGRGDASQ